jgi:nitroreductase
MKDKELKEIFVRKCCREFDTSKEISKDDLELIMKAGQSAPSAKNRQPYYFVAIRNKECRKEIYMTAEKGRRKQFAHYSEEKFNRTSKGETGSNDSTIYEASAAILVFRVLDSNYSEANEQSENLNIKEEQGVSNAAYSMMLQAEHMGFSTGWVCSPLYIEEEIKEILLKYGVKYQDSWKPRVILPIGYCKEKGEKISRESLSNKSIIVE